MWTARGRPAHLTEAQYRRLMAGGSYLWDHMGDAPVLLVPCLKKRDMPPRDKLPPPVATRYEAHLAHEEKIRGSSIYPAVQNIILACRSLGLGTLINGILNQPKPVAVGDEEMVDPKGRPYARYSKYLVQRPMTYAHPHSGESVLTAQLRVTPAGIAYIRRRLGGIGREMT